jgi:transcriptional regulator with XRE-family HTH domain
MKAKELLGKRIRELRKARGLTLEELASEAGTGDKFLGAIERGQQSASINTIEKIARGLEVEVYELFEQHKQSEAALRRRATALLKKADAPKLRAIIASLEAMLH